jgi:hypothetical protein
MRGTNQMTFAITFAFAGVMLSMLFPETFGNGHPDAPEQH